MVPKVINVAIANILYINNGSHDYLCESETLMGTNQQLKLELSHESEVPLSSMMVYCVFQQIVLVFWPATLLF